MKAKEKATIWPAGKLDQIIAILEIVADICTIVATLYVIIA